MQKTLIEIFCDHLNFLCDHKIEDFLIMQLDLSMLLFESLVYFFTRFDKTVYCLN